MSLSLRCARAVGGGDCRVAETAAGLKRCRKVEEWASLAMFVAPASQLLNVL